jgi:1,2-dihydroxy-3-keto-5-methylthiopentene dioxygenase
MSQLTIFPEDHPESPLFYASDGKTIATELAKVGVRFERWQTNIDIVEDASSEQIIDAYRQDIERLVKETGYQTYDVINMYPNHPQKDELRQKFLSEHTHSDDEIRFFVKGKGLFSLHLEDKVYEVLCEKDDLISVPANTRHWFDMGEKPSFCSIRLFDTPAGWVANFTGSNIAEKFSRLAV